MVQIAPYGVFLRGSKTPLLTDESAVGEVLRWCLFHGLALEITNDWPTAVREIERLLGEHVPFEGDV